MPDLIPAAPGWYLKTADDPALEPVIAWRPSMYSEPDATAVQVLLPYIANGPGLVPSLIPRKSFERDGWEVVYLPNHAPATEDLGHDGAQDLGQPEPHLHMAQEPLTPGPTTDSGRNPQPDPWTPTASSNPWKEGNP
ncbi:hypothetical protein ABTY96_28410 [Streptomyces sp. NPDC096057]|uniref:hypothetical protein n=1 Tax=Streptomyces sp. NPDC096057 TaxID=3155543 RepID=UPI0033171D4B